jgi:hypothetical protein
MTNERGRVRFITLADEDQQPLGVVAHGGADWTVNCGQCSHSHASPTSPGSGVMELLVYIERAHAADEAVEAVEVRGPDDVTGR